MLLPFAFALAFAIRNPGDLRGLSPGLGGVFVPMDSLPTALQVIARALPLTYSVEALRVALRGGSLAVGMLDLGVLAGFAVILFVLAARFLARQLD
jgi:ABC-type multidrug transport system permease subunit